MPKVKGQRENDKGQMPKDKGRRENDKGQLALENQPSIKKE